jgi:ribosomal-protein-alanine N-acetyltransferase
MVPHELVKIRKATLKDLPAILRLRKRNNQPTTENLHALFKVKNPNEKCRFFIAEEDNGRIVGYARLHLYKWNSSASIIELLVNAEHRRKGVGTMLLKTAENFSRENKCRVLMFDTALDNIPAIQLYLKNGYSICGYNDELYQNGKTAIYLAKKL